MRVENHVACVPPHVVMGKYKMKGFTGARGLWSLQCHNYTTLYLVLVHRQGSLWTAFTPLLAA